MEEEDWGSGQNLADPHHVDNTYQWSDAGNDPDGGAFTDFLDKPNDPIFGEAASSSDVTGCFAGHCDGRLPNIVEQQTIQHCANASWVDPIFGPTALSDDRSTSTYSGKVSLCWAWCPSFNSSVVSENFKRSNNSVRAVRGGPCH